MNKNNGCLGRLPKKKKLLFWSWNSYLPHEWELSHVSFLSWWEATWHCPHCERTDRVHYWDAQEMMKYHNLSKCPSEHGASHYSAEDLKDYRHKKEE